MKKLLLVALSALLCLSAIAAPPQTIQRKIGFAWDPLPTSEKIIVKGFRLCWGTLEKGRPIFNHAVFLPGSGNDHMTINLMVPDGVPVVAFLTCVGHNGLESEPSNVVCWWYYPAVRGSNPLNGFSELHELEIVLNRPPFYPPKLTVYTGLPGAAE